MKAWRKTNMKSAALVAAIAPTLQYYTTVLPENHPMLQDLVRQLSIARNMRLTRRQARMQEIFKPTISPLFWNLAIRARIISPVIPQ